MSDSVPELTLPVREPYRLDLTATVLRRLSTNIVDVFDGTTYRRMLGDATNAVSIEVIQGSPSALTLRASGGVPGDFAPVVARMLGTDVDLASFYAATAQFPWLAKLVAIARGVKPPRYPTLWEAIVNAVVFQQVSIHAAAAILRRVIGRFAPLSESSGAFLAPFAPPQSIVDADPVELRALGLSVNKVIALRTLGRAVLDGLLDQELLERVPTPELVVQLQSFKGIGPWTAAVVALRGFGRLDVFPLRDSGVARTLKELSDDPSLEVESMLDALGSQRGMLYYYLLLGRLAARGEIALAPR